MQHVARNHCRVCGELFFPSPLLSYHQMPSSAQGFPSDENLHLDKGEDLDVNQCASCGLVQLSNAPVSYYKDVIRAAAFSEEMREFRLKQLTSWVNQYHLKDQKILEVGCGRGEYLSLLKLTGVDAYGIEHSKQAVLDCQHQGLQAFQGYFGETQNENIPSDFNGFMCLNFMEHWPDPNASLKAISEHLLDGAIGLVEVPNFDMILEKGLFSEFISDHLFYFTEDTFKFTLQKNGFEVLESKPVWHDYILSLVVRKRDKTDLSFFKQFRENISSQLNQFVDLFPLKQVAVWGAGHQALAVIALADLSKKIAYVIDSAPFKQGKYTPASHLPIVAPKQLNTQPVEAVIVMAASYSDEVARIIRSTYHEGIKVAILRDDGLEEIA
jgi:SAM-dependent methyltransferase